jgi:hypothetical protein
MTLFTFGRKHPFLTTGGLLCYSLAHLWFVVTTFILVVRRAKWKASTDVRILLIVMFVLLAIGLIV